MGHPISVRLKHAWAVLNGKVMLPNTIEELQFMTALTQTAASLTALSTAANSLIAENQSNATDLAAAQADLAQADSETAASINSVVSSINAALPAPAPAAVEAPAEPAAS